MERSTYKAQHCTFMEKLLVFLRSKTVECMLRASHSKVNLPLIDGVLQALLYQGAKNGLSHTALDRLSISLNTQGVKDNISLTYLERKIADILICSRPVLLLFNEEGMLTETHKSLFFRGIDLGGLICQTFPGILEEKKAVYLEPLEQKERRVIELTRDKRYHNVTLIKKDGTLSRVECQERMPTDKRVVDIMREAAFQDIAIKQEDGKPVHINRVIKTKL